MKFEIWVHQAPNIDDNLFIYSAFLSPTDWDMIGVGVPGKDSAYPKKLSFNDLEAVFAHNLLHTLALDSAMVNKLGKSIEQGLHLTNSKVPTLLSHEHPNVAKSLRKPTIQVYEHLQSVVWPDGSNNQNSIFSPVESAAYLFALQGLMNKADFSPRKLFRSSK